MPEALLPDSFFKALGTKSIRKHQPQVVPSMCVIPGLLLTNEGAQRKWILHSSYPGPLGPIFI